MRRSLALALALALAPRYDTGTLGGASGPTTGIARYDAQHCVDRCSVSQANGCEAVRGIDQHVQCAHTIESGITGQQAGAVAPSTETSAIERAKRR
jgi:hypothetical protein